MEKITQLKFQLENLRQEQIKGLVLRSKVQWLEEGEKPTKFFASQQTYQ